MPFDAAIDENIKTSLAEIPHPALPKGSNIYGGTKIFFPPDYKAEDGETYFTLVHGIAHESSVSFVAVLQATRALRKASNRPSTSTAPPAPSTALPPAAFRRPATPGSRASRTSTTHSRPSSARVAPCSAAASAWLCTVAARRTSSPGG